MNILTWSYDLAANPTVDGFVVYGDNTAIATLPSNATEYIDTVVRAAPVIYVVVPTVASVAQVGAGLPVVIQTFKEMLPDCSLLTNRAKYVEVNSNGLHPVSWYKSFGKTQSQSWKCICPAGDSFNGKYWSAVVTYDSPTIIRGVSISTTLNSSMSEASPSIKITLHGDGTLLGTLTLSSEDIWMSSTTYNMPVSNPSLYLAYKITVTIDGTDLISTSDNYNILYSLSGIRFQGEI